MTTAEASPTLGEALAGLEAALVKLHDTLVAANAEEARRA